jgi:hypothetical protein
MRELIALLSVLVSVLQRLAGRKEQERAQDEREQIDSDSAQYSADKFGDGRVRPLDEWRPDAHEAKRFNDPGR